MLLDSSSTLLNIGLARRMTIRPHLLIDVLKTLGHTIVIKDSKLPLLPKKSFGSDCFLYPLNLNYMENEFHFYCVISVSDKTTSELSQYLLENCLAIWES